MRRPSLGSRKVRGAPRAPLAQVVTGLVYRPDSAEACYEEREDPDEIIVHVQQIPSLEEHEARMIAAPFWSIPEEGDEVVLFLPPGDTGHFEPMCLPMSMFRSRPAGLVKGDAVIVPRAGKKVRLGAAAGTQKAVLGNNLEGRLAALEQLFAQHIHTVPSSGGFSGTAITGTIPNPPHDEPGHVHDSPEPTIIAGPASTPPGGLILSDLVELA